MKSTARLRIGVLLILIVMGLVSSLGTAWRTGDWEGLLLNLGTEMLGAIATYVLLELFIGGRERREAKKADLIAQMGSKVRDVAVAAAEELRQRGWLYDGSLRGADLRGDNLPDANLGRANLQEVILFGANLQGVYLKDANLQGADLVYARLQGANLSGANLQGAYLGQANLQRAQLHEVNLQGARLVGANLEGVLVPGGSILPDGTRWTPDTNMARFTDFDHPDFWQPDAE